MLRNLLDNAARHARTTVTASLTERGNAAALIVIDDCPGILLGDRERIFERFGRLDHGRGRAEGGAGLGLAIVRGIVTRMGGTVHVADQATFTVSLPLAHKSVVASKPGQKQRPQKLPSRRRNEPGQRATTGTNLRHAQDPFIEVSATVVAAQQG